MQALPGAFVARRFNLDGADLLSFPFCSEASANKDLPSASIFPREDVESACSVLTAVGH